MEYDTPTYYPPNTNKLHHNKYFVNSLYNGIVNELKRPLSNGEKKYLFDNLKQEIPYKYRNQSPAAILKMYIAAYITKFKDDSCIYDQIDIHELHKSQMGLKSEINITDFDSKEASKEFTNTFAESLIGTVAINNFLGANDIASLLSRISPSTVIKQEYITLDTRYRLLDNDGTKFFKWNAVYDNSDIQGCFNINSRVRDVVSIKCLPIKMPYKSTADNDYGRITLLIQEFQSQAYIAHENTKFHFVFASDVQDRWIHLRAHNYNDGIFKFATPITQLSTLTISLSSPLQPVIFDSDRLNMFVSDYKTGNKTYFTGAGEHNLETGDTVYISDFNTLNPAKNAPIIGAINTQYGNTITYVDNFTFYLDIDSSAINQIGTGTISVVNGNASIIGVGTSFTSFFVSNDIIAFTDTTTIPSTPFKLKIKSILSDTSLVLEEPYTGGTLGALAYQLDNRIPNLSTQIYFGSKRIFMYFEVSYIDRGISS